MEKLFLCLPIAIEKQQILLTTTNMSKLLIYDVLWCTNLVNVMYADSAIRLNPLPIDPEVVI